MSPRKGFTPKSTAPLDTLDDSRKFIAQGFKAFQLVKKGETPGQAFSEFIVSLGYFPIDEVQWEQLRDAFIGIAEDRSDLSAELQTDALLKACPWLESDYARSRRMAEKMPPRRDGKQPPRPSPFANM